MNDIFMKELDIMCMKYEKSISDLVNVYEINYFSEKGED